jgi:hypothetical protein
MKILASHSTSFSKKIFSGDDMSFLISFLEEPQEILQDSTIQLLSVIAGSDSSLASNIISNKTIPVMCSYSLILS